MAPCAGRHLAARTRPAGIRWADGRPAGRKCARCSRIARPITLRRAGLGYLFASISAVAIGTISEAVGDMMSITASPALNIPTESPDIVPVEIA